MLTCVGNSTIIDILWLYSCLSHTYQFDRADVFGRWCAIKYFMMKPTNISTLVGAIAGSYLFLKFLIGVINYIYPDLFHEIYE